MKFMLKRLSVLGLLLAFALSLTGCLSHWFLDSSTRLQIENRTPYTFEEFSVVSEDGSKEVVWISETVPPGERSRVYEQDWVGEFTFRLRFSNQGNFAYIVKAGDASLEFSGGSYYVVLTENEDGSIHIESR